MGGIVHIQVGHCGNNIGNKFWEIISDEHGIGPDGTYKGDSPLQLERIGVYFDEMKEKKYFPRAILVDLEPEISNSLFSPTYRKLFRPDNFVFGKGSTSNLWPRGFYGEGRKFAGQVLNVVRKEVERIDYLQGFHLTHSLGGGTGSGLGSVLISRLNDQYPKHLMSSFSVFPSTKVLSTAVDSYNTVLSINEFAENVHEIFCIDNEALYDICLRKLEDSEPTNDDLNHLASMVMSGITSCLRFPGRWNLDKLAVNMTPYPKLHFLMSGFAPLVASGPLEVNALIQQLFDARNMITACDPTNGHCMVATAMFRGPISMHELKTRIINSENKKSSLVAEWIPNNITLDLCKMPAPKTTINGTFLANTTAIKEMFIRIAKGFKAENTVKSLISEYQRCQDMDAKNKDEVISNQLLMANDVKQPNQK
ncbi:Tubulin/FtsZ family, GTPase domain protein [Onchocerca flexuosa]|uniref:Tubulin beta chain n=1 Tax=Onchocerca flexuosa TaxID=387005 RepID=A0A238BVZ4_9BILA|nr:Tubulin/FtsZ family, GTPase domain protein [Onchocerca flexuosa]